MPVAISFTTETDGRLPSGETLDHAIARTDDATGGDPAYYMINCAHPTHLAGVLERAARGASGFAACARTRRGGAMRSWTRAPISTRAIPTSWRGSTPSSGPHSRGCRWWAGAAGRTTATSTRSVARSEDRQALALGPP